MVWRLRCIYIPINVLPKESAETKGRRRDGGGRGSCARESSMAEWESLEVSEDSEESGQEQAHQRDNKN